MRGHEKVCFNFLENYRRHEIIKPLLGTPRKKRFKDTKIEDAMKTL